MTPSITKQILLDLMPKLNDEELNLIRNWRIFDKAIIKFKNMSNISLFTSILDDEKEAIRLLKYYRQLDYKWENFETYLTFEQKNLFHTFILKYCL